MIMIIIIIIIFIFIAKLLGYIYNLEKSSVKRMFNY